MMKIIFMEGGSSVRGSADSIKLGMWKVLVKKVFQQVSSLKFASMITQTARKKKTARQTPDFTVNRMLVALELGVADESVLDYLDFFTAEIDVKQVQLLHVMPSFELFQSPEEREAESVLGRLEFNQEIIEEMHRRIERHAISSNSAVRFDIREGNPLGSLLQEAGETHADLLVIGQRADVSDHGILAANLTRKSKANVLILPEGMQTHLRHIIVPIDFSPYSVKALQTALAIRRAMKEPVRITCMHVYELPNLNIYLIEKIEDVRRIVQQDRLGSFKLFLEQFAPAEVDNLEMELVERQFGGIASYIYDFAAKEGGDFIIIGAKGHSKVERMLLGSVTERLLGLNDSIPTLIVRD